MNFWRIPPPRGLNIVILSSKTQGVRYKRSSFFLLDQDLLAGISGAGKVTAAFRCIWPHLITLRTLMVGCAAGEGHIDGASLAFNAMPLLAERIPALAQELGAKLIVLKEFPARYRPRLRCFEQAGFKRIPSMPMTRLRLDFASFDDFVAERLGTRTRRDLRRKFRTASLAGPIEFTVTRDITSKIAELYPLYLQVFQRSNLRFENLTPEFF